jgi:hypothetical protein
LVFCAKTKEIGPVYGYKKRKNYSICPGVEPGPHSPIVVEEGTSSSIFEDAGEPAPPGSLN